MPDLDPTRLLLALLAGVPFAALGYAAARALDRELAPWGGAFGFMAGAVFTFFGWFVLPVTAVSLGMACWFFPQIPRRSLTALLVVLFSVWAAYVGLPLKKNPENPLGWSALANGFAYDDKDLITQNDFLIGFVSGAPDIEGNQVDYLRVALTSDFAQLAKKKAGAPSLSPINYYRPVIALSYLLDAHYWSHVVPWETFERQGGKRADLDWTYVNPVGFHLTNVLFHALNSLLVFLLIRSLLRRHTVALIAAVLYAVHPIHTESVTWIAGRTDVIGTTFVLAAFWAYVRARNRGSGLAYGVALALFLTGLFAKEMGATLGLFLLLYELVRFWARTGGGGIYLGRPGLRVGAPEGELGQGLLRASLFLPLVGVYFLVKGLALAHEGPPRLWTPPMDPWFNPATGKLFSVDTIFFTFLKAVVWYMKKCVWPWPLEIYPNVTWAGTALGLGLFAGHAVLLGAALWALVRRPALRVPAYALVAFYVSLGPLSCVLPFARLLRFAEDVDFPVAERFLYLPSLFAVLFLAWLCWAAGQGLRRRWVAGLLALLLALPAVAAVQRRHLDWFDDFHLFRSGVTTNPWSVRMANNYGFELMQKWEIRAARRELTRCTELVRLGRGRRAPMPIAYQNLGHSYYLQGEFREAVMNYKQAFRQNPKDAVAANNLGALLGIFGSITLDIDLIREGLQYYQHAVGIAPQYVYSKQSVEFMYRVYHTWRRYLSGDRSPRVVWSFGNSFFFAAKSISESEDPKYLQAMLVLDSGLRHLPSDAEMLRIFGPPRPDLVPYEKIRDVDPPNELKGQIKRHMEKLFDRCFQRGIQKYRRLLKAGYDKPTVHFLLGEVYRIGWRRRGRPEYLAEAEKRFRRVLGEEPDHPGATRGLVEVLRARGRLEEAERVARACIRALLTPQRPWDEPVPPPSPRAYPRRAMDLAEEIATQAAAAGDGAAGGRWTAFLRWTWEQCVAYLRRRAEMRKEGEDAEAWNNVGYFYIRAAHLFGERRYLREALRYLDRALALEPDRPGPALNKIVVLRELGRTGEAEKLRQRMFRRYPRDPRFWPPRPAGPPPGQGR